MEHVPNAAEILAQFDRLVKEGILVFNKDYRTITKSFRGLPVEFRIISNIAKKPSLVNTDNNNNNNNTTITTNPPAPSPIPILPPLPPLPKPQSFRPGSDINTAGYEIGPLPPHHVLTFNKYPAARPHFLILTQDGYRRQREALNAHDLAAMWSVLTTFSSQTNRRYLASYNCGLNSGCSRMHKHMHVFPAPDPETSEFTLWPDRADEQRFQETRLPFRCAVAKFQPGTSDYATPQGLYSIYLLLLKRADEIWVEFDGNTANKQEGIGNDGAIAHNVILDREWMVVIPRRKNLCKEVGTNSPGMMGMVWVQSEEMMNRWIELDPCEVLADLGVPSDWILNAVPRLSSTRDY